MPIIVVIAALLVVVCAENVDVPPRCCFAKTWEGTMATAQTAGSQGSMTTSMMVMSYDISIKKFALQEMNNKFRVVADYNKSTQYVITPDGKCTTSKLPSEMLTCIPDTATFIETVVYGGPHGMVLDKWALKLTEPGPLDVYLAVTRDTCVFVNEVIMGTISGGPLWQAIEFSNITYAIKDPSVFNVPSPPCPADQDLNMVTGKTSFFMGL
ncbi:uncharacterized protein LOC118411170 [Branchiostoma floridae]|uniref:Uncharacterized protein LOC118411170 n=1 Tax=Branchiostoma floridae TaxID=7739 RepID=A0A9J7KS16_BRAFL|nr:uncharacterized protein LOC118411170 [Branchiostoma floridae]